MIEFSLDRNSEMGVLIGEILEIVVVQYFALFDKYIAKNKDKALTISIISPIIYELSNSILLNDDELIFSSLKHLRWHATKTNMSLARRMNCAIQKISRIKSQICKSIYVKT